MKDINYKDTYAWQDSIDLLTHLNRLIEDLPSSEQAGLGLELRRTATDLAAGIAADLLSGAEPRLEPALRVDTQLEVVARVYPALDAASAEQALSKVLVRLRSGQLGEVKTAPIPVPTDQDDNASRSSEDEPQPAQPPLVEPQATISVTPSQVAGATDQTNQLPAPPA